MLCDIGQEPPLSYILISPSIKYEIMISTLNNYCEEEMIADKLRNAPITLPSPLSTRKKSHFRFSFVIVPKVYKQGLAFLYTYVHPVITAHLVPGKMSCLEEWILNASC